MKSNIVKETNELRSLSKPIRHEYWKETTSGDEWFIGLKERRLRCLKQTSHRRAASAMPAALNLESMPITGVAYPMDFSLSSMRVLYSSKRRSDISLNCGFPNPC